MARSRLGGRDHPRLPRRGAHRARHTAARRVRGKRELGHARVSGGVLAGMIEDPTPLDEPSYFLRLGDDIIVDRNVMLRMRDGVNIAVDVYRPAQPGRYPVLYSSSPYRKDLAHLPPWSA